VPARAFGAFGEESIEFDLTELPGLDDLSQPSGVIADLEARLAAIFGARASLISCNGASAGILAAMLFLARRGDAVLVPRNCHRSIVNGLILSGLEPLWYEPAWETDWGIWGAVKPEVLSAAIEHNLAEQQHSVNGGKNIAGIWLVSPTYAGAVSDVKSIASICHKFELPLVVDEAHGAALLTDETVGLAALHNNADLVIHSLSKHLTALTQAAVLHIGKNGERQFGFKPDTLRALLNTVLTTSPSYLLLKSIDLLVDGVVRGSVLRDLVAATEGAVRFRQWLGARSDACLYDPEPALSPLHVLFRSRNQPTAILERRLQKHGVYTETILGRGLLGMFGANSTDSDVAVLQEVLSEVLIPDAPLYNAADCAPADKPSAIQQIMSPRAAFFAPQRYLPKKAAVGKVAATCIAPCPPGFPLLLPGQKVEEETIKKIEIDAISVVDDD
jgi:arginine/lysine/ornithine decarboxylase